MFGLFEGKTKVREKGRLIRKDILEKRVLAFSSAPKDGAASRSQREIEIRAYRADGKKRMQPQVGKFREKGLVQGGKDGGVS